jgi:lipopolysaccharide/colanic/teichoic acid biosynthesis glycosyltransferase
MSAIVTQISEAQDIPWLAKYRPHTVSRGYLIAKRAMDLALILISMPVWFPLVCLIALMIKIKEPAGPVLFIQDRIGKGGKSFPFFKFRTMVVNARELEAKLVHLNELKWPDFKISKDPRITPLGGILRKTSLDEIPQLFNILRGEMSLVGPRPTNFGPQDYALWHTERLDVRPGLTGLWQVVGRASTEFDERLRLDIAYIERRCLMLDIEILFRTIGVVLLQRGAY